MDEANIARIEQLRREADTAQDKALEQELDEQIRAEEQKTDVREVLTGDIVRGTTLIRQFMRKMARKQTGFWGMSKPQVKLYSYWSEYKYGRVYGIETKMFDTEDDVDSFTRSGWALQLEEWKYPDDVLCKPYRDLEFKTDLTVIRKTISLDRDGKKASEPWYKIHYKTPAISHSSVYFDGQTGKISSLPAAQDKEREEAHVRYRELSTEVYYIYRSPDSLQPSPNYIVDEKLRQGIDPERDAPKIGSLALQHCHAIIQTALTSLKIPQ